MHEGHENATAAVDASRAGRHPAGTELGRRLSVPLAVRGLLAVVFGMFAWIGNTRVEVRDGVLHAGPAHIEVRHLGEVEALDKDGPDASTGSTRTPARSCTPAPTSPGRYGSRSRTRPTRRRTGW